jgi:branched-chain amino acid transport system permease protein
MLALFAAAVTVPLFVSSPVTVARIASGLYIALAAVGLNFAVGLAGMPSLGQGAFVGAGAFTTAALRVHAGWEPVPATIAGVALALVAGVAVGIGAIRLRGVFVAVSTWIVAWMLSFILTAFPSLSGGSQGLALPAERAGLPFTGVSGVLSEGVHYEIALVLLGVALLAFVAVARGPVGLALAAAREGPSQASALGVDRSRLQLGVFVAAAVVGGLAGALSVQLAGVADPSSYGPLLSVELFVAVLLGGEGRILGPVVGAGLLAAIPGAARGLGSFAGVGLARYEPVLAAALLVVGLLLGRGGTVGLIQRGLSAVGMHTRKRTAATPASPSADLAPRRGPLRLEATDLRRRFGGVAALDGVSIAFEPGSIHAVVGPNGSGKTTLLRVVAGTVEPDDGTVLLGSTEVTSEPAERRARLGLVRTLQRTAIFAELTALQHVMAGATAGRESGGAFRTLFATPRSRAETRSIRQRAAALLHLAGLADRTDTPAGSLEAGEQRLLMVATAAASLPSVMLLDEPAAGMAPPDEDRLESFLRALASHQVAVAIVEHDFPLVTRLAGTITVLDAGKVIAAGPPEEVRAMPDVREAYLGTNA